MLEREDYDIVFVINILMILYNRVLVPTLGKINKINKSYPHRTQTSPGESAIINTKQS